MYPAIVRHNGVAVCRDYDGNAKSAAPHEDSLLELIRTRRSIRRYTQEPVDRSVLEQLFDAARWAPSNWNGQPWVFVVIDDPPLIARVHALLDARATALTTAADGDVRLAHFVEHCRKYFHVLRESPVLVAACYKPSGQVFEETVARHFADPSGVLAWSPNLLSLGMAVQNLLLAAHAAGLGACFHSGPVAFLRGPLHNLLDLPPRLELAGFVTLGWPAPEAPARQVERKPLAHVVRWAQERDV